MSASSKDPVTTMVCPKGNDWEAMTMTGFRSELQMVQPIRRAYSRVKNSDQTIRKGHPMDSQKVPPIQKVLPTEIH